MKKIVFLLAVALSATFVACEGNEKTEDVGVGAGAAISALEVLSDTTKPASDTTTLACTCEHKCKTKEDCVKTCGEGCGSLK